MIRSLFSRATRALQRFWRARAGIAAVEFAFIMPMMLVLYFGISLLGQGLEISRKTQQASRTIADLTTQQLPSNSGGTTSNGCLIHAAVPCVSNTELADFFAAAQLVMTPFPSGASVMSAAISEIVFDNVSTSDKRCCQARVVWSVGFGTNPPVRSCGVAGLTPVDNGTNGPTLMPLGNYPTAAGDVTHNNSVLNNSSSNTTDYYLIVADVTYKYQPGYDFKLFTWGGSGATYTIRQTTYMSPRSGNALAQTNTLDSGAQQTQAILWSNTGTSTATVTNNCAAGTDYYLP